MRKDVFFKYALIALVALNLTLVALFLFNKPNHPPRHGPPPGGGLERAIVSLGLDKEQTILFKNLAHEHHRKFIEIQISQQQIIQQYFNLPRDSSTSELSKQILNEITQLEIESVELSYNHFEDVKELLREDQLANFDRFKEHVLTRLLSTNRPRKPPMRR